MIKASKIAFLAFVSAVISSVLAVPAYPEEEKSCGIVHQQRREPIDSQRFWLLAEYGGQAFIDMRTCLVWSLEVQNQPVTLSDAMYYCATLGQGGPYGEMGWQLPTVSELTSLDGEEWENQRSNVPPLTRSETQYWTSTPWLGSPGVSVVIFSERTTIVHPAREEKASVWCVRGFPARGLQ